jgi:hypothetical protein
MSSIPEDALPVCTKKPRDGSSSGAADAADAADAAETGGKDLTLADKAGTVKGGAEIAAAKI